MKRTRHVMLLLCVCGGGLIWIAITQSKFGLQGHYYTNIQWEGDPAIIRLDAIPRLKDQEGDTLLATPTFSVRWTGWIAINQAGIYRFATMSDDGSFLWINGQEVVNNGGVHGLKRESGEILLDPGIYPFEVRYFQIGGNSILRTYWQPPDTFDKELIPATILFPKDPGKTGLFLRKSRLLLSEHSKTTWIWLLICLGGLVLLTGLYACRSFFHTRRILISQASLVSFLQKKYTIAVVVCVALFVGMLALWMYLHNKTKHFEYAWISDAEKTRSPFTNSYDLLHELQPQMYPETERIDFRNEANSAGYLLDGWSQPKEDATRTKKTRSSLRFYRYDTTHDLEIAITCRLFRAGATQPTHVRLNGMPIGTFTVASETFHVYPLTLPASALRFGQNILEFYFPGSTETLMSTPDSENQRNIVAFQTIVFSTQSHLRYVGETGLLQRANSGFDLFWNLPNRIELDCEYQNLHDTNSYIELINERGQSLRLNLPSDKEQYTKAIYLKEAGPYKIHFATEGPPNRYAIWKQIRLRTKTPEQTNQKQQGFAKRTQPDIVLYVVDTLRADHVSAYGYGRKTTPNLDAFAQENALFRNAYAPASWTKPSCASMLSGLLPKNHKTITREDKLPEEVVTLAEILRESGYYTAAFVTNGHITSDFGFDQGFMKSVVFPPSKNIPTLHYPSNKVNESVFSFLQSYVTQEDRRPIFMLVWTIDPHDPYTRLNDVKDMFNVNQYTPIDTNDPDFIKNIRAKKIQPTASQIEYMQAVYDQEIYFNDRSFGGLLNNLKSLSLYDETLIIFTADHGEEFYEHGGVHHGLTLYNEQIRIPFVIKAPYIEKGEHAERMQLIDIYPTILDVLGIEEPYQLDGISLRNITDPKRSLYFEEDFQDNKLEAILNAEKKLIYNRGYNRSPSAEALPPLELYDEHDPDETQNLAFETFADSLMLQQLHTYISRESALGISQVKVEMTPELDQKLRDLGYVK